MILAVRFELDGGFCSKEILGILNKGYTKAYILRYYCAECSFFKEKICIRSET